MNGKMKYYSAETISKLCTTLRINNVGSVDKIRRHIKETGLATRTNRKDGLKYAVSIEDVPLVIRDLTGQQVEIGDIYRTTEEMLD